jgi:hypothetical protein
MCFVLHGYDLPHKGPHKRSSTKGEHSSMVDDTPTLPKHGHQSHVMGTFKEWFWKNLFSKEFIEHQIDDFNTL